MLLILQTQTDLMFYPAPNLELWFSGVSTLPISPLSRLLIILWNFAKYLLVHNIELHYRYRQYKYSYAYSVLVFVGLHLWHGRVCRQPSRGLRGGRPLACALWAHLVAGADRTCCAGQPQLVPPPLPRLRTYGASVVRAARRASGPRAHCRWGSLARLILSRIDIIYFTDNIRI